MLRANHPLPSGDPSLSKAGSLGIRLRSCCSVALWNGCSLTLLFFGTAALAGTVELPQTGQTKCYDTAGTEIACAGTGQDGEIQAGVAWPDPRFQDNGDGMITD